MGKLKYLFGFLILMACAIETLAATDINKDSIDQNRPYLIVQLVYNYDVYQKPIFFKPKAVPSYAIWVEAPDSGYQKSIFITMKAAKNKWSFTSKRPEVIPVWYGKKKKEENHGNLNIDAISAATPLGDVVTVYWQIPETLLDRKATLFIEANNSFDFNEHYHRKWGEPGYSAVNGQPSMVWGATLNFKGSGTTISPRLLGHGHVMGKSNAVDPDLSRITSAAQTFRKITVRMVLPDLKISKNEKNVNHVIVDKKTTPGRWEQTTGNIHP